MGLWGENKIKGFKEFSNFQIGQNPLYRTIDVKRNTGKRITLEQAIKAVGGNALQNFIQRVKLFFITFEWYNKANIKNKLKSHDYKTLRQLDKLFHTIYPVPSQIRDKRVLNFMTHFVQPRLVKQGNKEFRSRLSDKNQKLLKKITKEPIAAKNLAKLVAMKVRPQELFEQFPTEPPAEVLKKLHDETEMKRIMELIKSQRNK